MNKAPLEIKAFDTQAVPSLVLPRRIHPAEHESVQLTLQLKADLLLLDDWDARQVAETNFRILKVSTIVKSTLDMIVIACQQEVITRKRAIELLETIKLRRDIWINAGLCDQVIWTIRFKQSGERATKPPSPFAS